ncbi:hypothetical protein FBU30_002985, partial [Linnemannia zychae]
MALRVHKLSVSIEAAVDIISRSSVKIDSNKAKAVKSCVLSSQELNELKDICDLLEPAAPLTHSLGGSRCPAISSVYPRIHGYALFPPITSCTTLPARELHTDLKNQVGARFDVDTIPDATLIAMFLNPGCFSFSIFDIDSQFLTKAKDLTRKALLELAQELDAETIAAPVPDQASFRDILTRRSRSKNESKALAELDEYFASCVEESNLFDSALNVPQTFWPEAQDIYPLMSVLARAYLCAQATSSESERLF